jgi:glycerol transport system substrate-binding protein
MDEYGGIIEFYRSPDDKRYTAIGRNVPHYARLAPFWWKNISKAMTGELTPHQAMDQLAKEQDAAMESLKMAAYSPMLNKEKKRKTGFTAIRRMHLPNRPGRAPSLLPCPMKS